MLTDQERGFLRAVLSWIQYKFLEFEGEKEVLLTDTQLRKRMREWGVVVEEDGPTIRRLKAKLCSEGGRVASVFPFLVRTFKGRVVRGKGEPSRYRVAPALAAAILALPELGETEPDPAVVPEEAADSPDEALIDTEPPVDPDDAANRTEDQDEPLSAWGR